MFFAKAITILVVSLNLLSSSTALPAVDEPVVTLHHGGQVKGSFRYSNITSKQHFAFVGIPYAEPPVKELRFKATVLHKGWNGIKTPTVTVCPQLLRNGTFDMIGQEDCLYLNVFTPITTPKNKEKYPVMFYIHGGSYMFGSGTEENLNPELLVAEDVIAVQINYRLGIFGFFSTGDKNCPGNFGLKDSLEALKWVQSNIEAFGGDKNKVTVFGNSGGGMLTNYLVLSPLSKGLFHQTISMSGMAITSVAFQEYPRTIAFQIAKKMNITFDTTEDLMERLMEIDDPKVFLNAVITPNQPEIPQGRTPPTFSPCIEPEDSLEDRIIPEHPLSLLLKGNFIDIPLIITITDEEWLIAMNEIKDNPNLFKYIDDHPESLLPNSWKIEPNSIEAAEYHNRIYSLYFNNKPIEDPYDYTHFSSDLIFNYGSYKAARLHIQKQRSPVYFSIFSFTGDLNYYKIRENLTEYVGACHADDLPYLYLNEKYPKVSNDNPAHKIRQRMIRMWTNFAKYGDPTKYLDELVDVKWPAMTEGRIVYLNIGDELKVDKDPFGERMHEWWDMDKKFN